MFQVGRVAFSSIWEVIYNMRIALTLEYDGGAFHGWQAQTGLRTVQTELERALGQIADHAVRVVVAGRTDAGVHATHQIVHFDTQSTRSVRDWVVGVNHYLPKDISIRAAQAMPEHFHARFSALSRSYEYWIDTHSSRPALRYKQVAWMPRAMDANLMHSAAQQLIGRHDFSAFRASDCQAKSPVRTITQLSVERNQQYIVLRICANAFLHHMVRNIVGTLLPIGLGLMPSATLTEILHSKQRAQAGMTAPAEGLYLCQVTYPAGFFDPE